MTSSVSNGADPLADVPPPTLAEKEPTPEETLRLGPGVKPKPDSEALPFPPPEPPPAKGERPATPPLAVVRTQPVGSVETTDRVVVQFNQPMIPLSALSDQPKSFPIEITPLPKGRFLWLDVQTVVFEAGDGRLPYATSYSVRVPAGVKSALGSSLAQEQRFTFDTPPPKIESANPGNGAASLPLDSKVRLHANAALGADFGSFVSVETAAGKKVPFKLEPGSDDGYGIPPERRITVVPQGLERDTEYVVRVREGWKSSEGPKAGVAFVTKLRTYGPLTVAYAGCGRWRGEEACPPYMPLTLEFSNELEKPTKDLISITPAVGNIELRHYGSNLEIAGAFKPETTYKITAKAALTDRFGQKLGRDSTHAVRIGQLNQMFQLARDFSPTIVESGDRPVVRGWAANVPSLDAKIAPLTVAEYLSRVDELYGEDKFDGLKTTTLKVQGSPKNESAQFEVPLDKVLTKGRGLALVEVSAKLHTYPEMHRTIVQATDLGLLAAFSSDTLLVQVTSLTTGKPLAGVAVGTVAPDGKEGPTQNSGADGRVSLKIGLWNGGGIVARLGNDLAVLPLQNNGVNASLPPESVHAFTYTDRGIYRPGEVLHIATLVRARSTGPKGDLLPARAMSATITIRDPSGEDAQVSKVRTDDFGAAYLGFTIPAGAALGDWRITVGEGNSQYGSTHVRVEEFRAPELKVEASISASSDPALAGMKAKGSITASYYSGGPVTGQSLQWALRRTPLAWIPPNNDGFRFGEEKPFWLDHWGGRGRGRWRGDDTDVVAQGNATTDGRGTWTGELDLVPDDEESAATYTLEGTVFDANRRAVAGRASVVAHRTLRRVGVRLSRAVLQPGDETTVDVVAVKLDGKREKDVPVTVKLVLRESTAGLVDDVPAKKRGGMAEPAGEWRDTEIARCDVKSGESPVSCKFTPKKGGSYRVVATVKDSGEREDTAIALLWVAGGATWAGETEPTVELITDKASYVPGDKARVLVRSPFPVARGLLTIGREGFARTFPIDTTDGSALVEFEVEGPWAPSVEITAAVAQSRTKARPATGHDQDRPRFAMGSRRIDISLDERRLRTTVEPSRTSAAPREEIAVRIRTTDPKGKAIASHVTVMVVDEAVLALTAQKTPDPLPALYPSIDPGLVFLANQNDVPDLPQVPRFTDEEMFSADRKKMAEAPAMAAMGMRGGGGGGAAPPMVRADFATTPFFEAKLRTDENGIGEVRFKLPDNLTQFRVMAVATDKEKLSGSGESSVTSRLPLQVRPSLPRFLNVGDLFEASAVVDNKTNDAAHVVVRMLAANATIETTHRTVKLAPGESKEVRFPARAGKPGPAKFQVAAIIDGRPTARDAAEVIVPTLIPATSEAFATYGSTETSVAVPIERPKDALPGYGGLEVQLSSSALTNLRDAVAYLVDYPFGCTEQTASRILPLAVLKDVLPAFGITLDGGVDPAKAVREGVAVLRELQRPDGSFGFWKSSEKSSLQITAWVAFVLLEVDARKLLGNDWQDRRVLDGAIEALPRLVRAPPNEWERGPEAKALAALVLARAGRADTMLLGELSKTATLPVFTRAQLAAAWALSHAPDAADRAAEQLRFVRNAAVDTAGTVHFAEATTESTRLLLHSSDLSDAIVLWSLLQAAPNDVLVDKVARGLTAQRKRGHWMTTHANGWAIVALGEVFAKREAVEPNFDARVWVGDTFAGGKHFAGRQLNTVNIGVPLLTLPPAADLLLSKEGPGRLYWRAGLRYAPADLKPAALDRGFVVTRTFESLDKDAVTKAGDGTWRVKAGKRVRVRLQVTVPDRRVHVALVDPMPAGFEAENTGLATTATVDQNDEDSHGGPWWRWWSPWTHTELRDDRAQAFSESLWAGVYEHSWVARAITPGTFIVPPARAEEMYAPETFGRTAADVVVVEP